MPKSHNKAPAALTNPHPGAAGDGSGVINHYVHQGYEFYRIDKVGVQVTPSCMASLFGASLGSNL